MYKRILMVSLVLSLLLSACSTGASTPVDNNSSSTNPPAATSSNEVKINISGFAFDPKSVTIAVGTTVTWTNMDDVVHDVVEDTGLFKSQSLSKGDMFQFTFDKAGTYTYHCGFHSSMKGEVIVQ